MPPRDQEKTARNRRINAYHVELQKLLPAVLQETGLASVHSLHGKIGGKFDRYLDIKHDVVNSEDQFVSLYLEGYKKVIDEIAAASEFHRSEYQTYLLLRRSASFKTYLYTFLKRTYLRYLESLAKKRPDEGEDEVWIGQNNADYGLLITPRFHDGQWSNDQSEIRHFREYYWTIGHVLKTGLVIPGKENRFNFANVEEYLNFFLNVIVRNSGSQYEYQIADLYCNFVRSEVNPNIIPLLIPEFRYAGVSAKHKYRLDFTIFDPIELTRIGIELSPWSTHGYLSKTKSMTQQEINDAAQNNFEKEMKKHKDFFRRHNIFTLIYTDQDLADIPALFAQIKRYLHPQTRGQQLQFHIMNEFLS